MPFQNGFNADKKDDQAMHDIQWSPKILPPHLTRNRNSVARRLSEQRRLPGEAGFTPLERIPSLQKSPLLQRILSLPKSEAGTDGDTCEEVIEPFAISVMYGLINTSMVVPVVFSFGSIIYSNDVFGPYLPVLVKLTLFSSAIHQFCFSTFSSLPFAVGQVQDAGLIFLSALASKIVVHCHSAEEYNDDEHILATVVVLLPLCTALLGLGLIVIGKVNLASHVQNLPTPVVGGYLAFIGFFCGQSGLNLMANTNVDSVTEWDIFAQRDHFILLLPGLIGGVFIYLTVRHVRHMATLPVCIAAIAAIFYLALAVTGTNLEQATEHGWINKADAPAAWYETWAYFKFDKVVWSAFPSLVITLISMTFVVALSSALDVAAIELELGTDLDYDHELQTVGLSNVISGLTGGYTGSYIFSCTIFSLRGGIRSRTNGYVVALVELIIVFLPFSVMSYLPNFFFGSLLVMICVDLMNEWLWDVRTKMTGAEYAITLSSFALIQIFGIEFGIFGSVLLYCVCYKLGMDLGISTDENTVEQTCQGSENTVSGNGFKTNGSNGQTNYGGIDPIEEKHDSKDEDDVGLLI